MLSILKGQEIKNMGMEYEKYPDKGCQYNHQWPKEITKKNYTVNEKGA